MKLRGLYLLVSLLLASSAYATTIDLGKADGFAVLAYSTVANTGSSVITGDLGVFPGVTLCSGLPSPCTGGGPGQVIGTIHWADSAASAAETDLSTAIAFLKTLAHTQDLSGKDLGGMTLTPGVYYFSSSAQLTGTLTLNAQGDPNALFVFLIGSTLTTASKSVVTFINGGGNDGDNTFWQVGSSATLGTYTTFLGNILANASITLTTGTTILCGRALALGGAVTMDTNTISIDTPGCETGPTTPVPEPPTFLLFATGGLIAMAGLFWKRKLISFR